MITDVMRYDHATAVSRGERIKDLEALQTNRPHLLMVENPQRGSFIVASSASRDGALAV